MGFARSGPFELDVRSLCSMHATTPSDSPSRPCTSADSTRPVGDTRTVNDARPAMFGFSCSRASAWHRRKTPLNPAPKLGGSPSAPTLDASRAHARGGPSSVHLTLIAGDAATKCSSRGLSDSCHTPSPDDLPISSLPETFAARGAPSENRIAKWSPMSRTAPAVSSRKRSPGDANPLE